MGLLFGRAFRVPRSYKGMWPSMAKQLRDHAFDDTILIARTVVLFLRLIQFVLPYNLLCLAAEAYVMHVQNSKRVTLLAYKANYLVGELYLLGKLALPVILLAGGHVLGGFLFWFIFAFVAETVTYVFGNVILRTRIPPVSYARSAVLLLLALITVTASFAYLYIVLGDVTAARSPMDAFVFSLGIASTIGSMDAAIHASLSLPLVMFQISASVLFFVAFFPVFFGRLQSNQVTPLTSGRQRRR